jgi:predicted ArsR family transcriptional regulator
VSSGPAWETMQLLAEPTRRALYVACRSARTPLTREELAATVGVSRRLAAFHLDALAEAGLLTVDYARPEGRRGPGAGRPAKRYAAVPVDIGVSVPARRYDLAARVMARGLATADEAAATAATFAAATDEGQRVGRANRAKGRLSAARTTDILVDVLEELGYEPRCDAKGCVELRNCPFDAAVAEATDVVCGLNLRFISGVLDGLDGHPSVRASLEPSDNHCCVTVRRD